MADIGILGALGRASANLDVYTSVLAIAALILASLIRCVICIAAPEHHSEALK